MLTLKFENNKNKKKVNFKVIATGVVAITLIGIVGISIGSNKGSNPIGANMGMNSISTISSTINSGFNFVKGGFENIINFHKNAKKADAYTGLADVYLLQDKTDEGTTLFEEAVSKQSGNVELYKACMDFYLKSDQNMEIPELLDSVSDSMLEKLSDYVVDEPKFSLEDSTTYDDVQKLLLTADKDTIYYTTDGTDPDLTSTKYTSEGIQISEGETTIKAIAVNKKGVPSSISKKIYTVEFPVEDAPAVSPSTGQYDEAVQIEVKVPEGYTAYYTTDGTDPTTASTKYTGPIDMPKGETLFKVVLVNGKGRMSGITTRNYMYDNQ